MFDVFGSESDLELSHHFAVEHHVEGTLSPGVDFLDRVQYLAECQFLHCVLDPNGPLSGTIIEADGDDGCLDVLSVVDDLVDTGHTLGDVHAGNTREVKGLEGHLGGWFPYTLCRQRPDSFSRLHDASVDALNVHSEEQLQLEISYPIETVPEVVLRLRVLLVLEVETSVVRLESRSFVVEIALQFRQQDLLEFLLKAHDLLVPANVLNVSR